MRLPRINARGLAAPPGGAGLRVPADDQVAQAGAQLGQTLGNAAVRLSQNELRNARFEAMIQDQERKAQNNHKFREAQLSLSKGIFDLQSSFAEDDDPTTLVDRTNKAFLKLSGGVISGINDEATRDTLKLRAEAAKQSVIAQAREVAQSKMRDSGLAQLDDLKQSFLSDMGGDTIFPDGFQNDTIATVTEFSQGLREAGLISQQEERAHISDFKASMIDGKAQKSIRINPELALFDLQKGQGDFKDLPLDSRERYIKIAETQVAANAKEAMAAQEKQREADEKRVTQAQEFNTTDFLVEAIDGTLNRVELNQAALTGDITGTQLRVITNFADKQADQTKKTSDKSQSNAAAETRILMLANDGEGVTINSILSDDRLAATDQVQLITTLKAMQDNPQLLKTAEFTLAKDSLLRHFSIPEGGLSISFSELSSRQAQQAAVYDEFLARTLPGPNQEKAGDVVKDIVAREFDVFNKPDSPLAKSKISQSLARIPSRFHVFSGDSPDIDGILGEIKKSVINGDSTVDDLREIVGELNTIEAIVGKREQNRKARADQQAAQDRLAAEQKAQSEKSFFDTGVEAINKRLDDLIQQFNKNPTEEQVK